MSSQKQILKNTSIIGGSQLATILIGIIRTKVLAVILGTTGIGLLSIYQNIIDIAKQSTGLGINFSGVKNIAESYSTSNEISISKSIHVLKKWALWTGLMGSFLMIIFSENLSNYSFGNSEHKTQIILISVSLLIMSISGSQIAILQGLKKIKEMAKATFFGALLGTLITIPVYLLLGVNGIVIGVLITSISGLIFSWMYTKNLKFEKIIISLPETFKHGGKMIELGLFITITGIMASISLYILRSFLLKNNNIESVGSFQAAWMISTLYLGVILNAMLADFFPRLSEVNNNNNLVNRLINEQIEIAILIASPMILGIIGLAEIIIKVLYSSEFILTIPILRWFIAGTFFTINSWPMGVLFLAKNKGVYSLLTETAWNLIFLLIIYFNWNNYDFEIIGYSYIISCFVRLILVYVFTKNLSEFKFNKINIKYSLFFGALILLLMVNIYTFSGNIQLYISILIISFSLFYSFYHLKKMINFQSIFIKIFNKNK